MAEWDSYPADYRAAEAGAILRATSAGDCVSVVGLSGAGKSNLLGFLANRLAGPERPFVLVDSNRLADFSPPAFLRLMRRTLGHTDPVEPEAELDALDSALTPRLPLTVLLDLSLLDRTGLMSGESSHALFNNLRALRDAHKYALTFVTASRRPLPADTEFAELIHANTLWLGCMNASDSLWNVQRFMQRKGLAWPADVAGALIELSRGYPSLLRAACEAYAEVGALGQVAGHPAVQKRVEEFWSDSPTPDELRLAGLNDHRLLQAARAGAADFDTSSLTAKENALLSYFSAHPDTVCEKDDIIRAVWPEDQVFTKGVRDDSLAQLVRRLREKIEPEPASPLYITTVPGRGYKFTRPAGEM